jgi:4-hydroxy-3-methylbut-2-en-1-yl diphosphate reductase
MSRVLIASPLGVEGALVRSAWRGARVRKTGMGTERSIAAARWLAREPADGLLVLGFCGGLDAHSVPGEVIVATEVYGATDEGHAPDRVQCPHAEPIATTLQARGLDVRSGPMVCVSKIALGERREQLLADGALAVEMESVWLAAGAAGRPLSVVRVVLDSPSRELMRPRAVFSALRAARALRAVAKELRGWTPVGQDTY